MKGTSNPFINPEQWCVFPEGFRLFKRKELLGELKPGYTDNEVIQLYYNYFYSVYHKFPPSEIIEKIEYIRDRHAIGEEIISKITFVFNPDQTMVAHARNNDINFSFKFFVESTVGSESYSRALAMSYAYKTAETELLHYLKFFKNRLKAIEGIHPQKALKDKEDDQDTPAGYYDVSEIDFA